MLIDGVYEDLTDDSADIASALLAGAAPVKPPRGWFEAPSLGDKTPLTVTSSGQVYGHIATWDSTHVGLPNGVRPPRSRSNYAFFRTGVLETEEGHDIPVGQLTLAGGHAPISADAGSAVKHYDDTASAVADVAVGEDSFGIWVAGALRPGVNDEQIRTLRASAPSGDWRPINGNLELVAVCQVNVPGFPVARAMVAGGELLSLVAAGARDMYELRIEQQILSRFDDLSSQIEDLHTMVAGGKPPWLKDKGPDQGGKDEPETDKPADDEGPEVTDAELMKLRLEEARLRAKDAKKAGARSKMGKVAN